MTEPESGHVKVGTAAATLDDDVAGTLEVAVVVEGFTVVTELVELVELDVPETSLAPMTLVLYTGKPSTPLR